jgi:hypothetical protein
MKVFPNAVPDLPAPSPEAEVSGPGQSVWVSAAWQISYGLVYLGISTVCRVIWPDISPASFRIVGLALAGSLAFLILAKKMGWNKKSNSADFRESLNPSPLMADATGWAIMMNLIFIGILQRVKFSILIGPLLTRVIIVGLGTLVRKLPGPPTANS